MTEETHETTEISAKIRDHNQGKITDDELVQYLTEDARYKPTDVNPYKPGTGEWFLWSECGQPYTPGSFQEVVKAADTGLLSDPLFDRVMAVFHSRMTD